MTVEASFSFASVIEEHLELKRRNAALDGDMPLEQYRNADPFENHPLFKSEEQARLEETLGGTQPMAFEEEQQEDVLPAGAAEEADAEDTLGNPEDTLWGRSRDFDWGD